MRNQITIAFALSVWAASITFTQAQIIGLNGGIISRAPLNNLIASRMYNLGEPTLKLDVNPTNPPAHSTLSDRNVALEYDFWRMSEQADLPYLYPVFPPGGLPILTVKHARYTLNTDHQTVSPSLFFEPTPNLAVTAGFTYDHSTADSPFSAADTQIEDEYTPFLAVDEELLQFLGGVDSRRTALFIGGNIAYSRQVRVIPNPPFSVNTFSTDIYSLAPSFVLIHSLVDWADGTPGRLSLTIRPEYDYVYSDEPSGIIYRAGIASLLGRLDFGLTKNLYLNCSATWLHDANHTPSMTGYHSWADLGAGIAYKIAQQNGQVWILQASYDYQGFYSFKEYVPDPFVIGSNFEDRYNLSTQTVSVELSFHF